MGGLVLRIVGLAAIAAMGWIVANAHPALRAALQSFDVAQLTPRTAAAEASAPAPAAIQAVAPAPAAPFLTPVVAEPPPSAPPAPAPTPPTAPDGAWSTEVMLALCPGMRVSNAPVADSQGVVIGFKPMVRAEGVALRANPAEGACLSSGFRSRNGRPHRGVDYHARASVPIRAGGDGVVRERVYRNDYGNMLLIDHGGGVFTRYAHLASFAPGMAPGAAVRAGDVIGQMGNTAGYRVPLHLHYEVLTGNYDTPRASFGLTALDPFALPPA